MKNTDLKKFYDKVYEKGEKKHYTKLIKRKGLSEEKKEVLSEVKWKGKRVLDVGCGTGELAHLISKRGASHCLGIDYSQSAIDIAREEHKHKVLGYECLDIKKIKGEFDVILFVGVLEHMDNPFQALRDVKKLLAKGGSIIVTCPNWSNVRGAVLLALRDLHDAKITLADIHYFTPLEIEDFAKKLRMKMKWRTFEQSWGHGERMIEDFKKRLPKLIPAGEGKNKRKVETYVKWLEKHLDYFSKNESHTGASGLYHFRK